MIPLADVAAHFRRMAVALAPALEAEVRLLMEAAAVDARESIGHELAGWPALAASTIREKQARGYGGQVSASDPLLRTGQLRDSVFGDTDSRTFGLVVAEVIGVVGSTDPVSIDQELGTSKIPPRPFWPPRSSPRSLPLKRRLGNSLSAL